MNSRLQNAFESIDQQQDKILESFLPIAKNFQNTLTNLLKEGIDTENRVRLSKTRLKSKYWIRYKRYKKYTVVDEDVIKKVLSRVRTMKNYSAITDFCYIKKVNENVDYALEHFPEFLEMDSLKRKYDKLEHTRPCMILADLVLNSEED